MLKPEGYKSGDAFPHPDYCGRVSTGMSLRDYFATHAMRALLTGDAMRTSKGQMAQYAYEIADAMIEEREYAR